MGLYTLTAADCSGPEHWHWYLHDVDADRRRNRLLAQHPVRLDPGDWQYLAWLDLHGYVRQHALPDRRREDERRIVAELGRWIGDKVFGPIGPKLVELAREEPVTVYVTVESEADKPAGQSLDEHVLFRPLELAVVDGQPLALHDVSLVFDTRPLELRPGRAGEDQLRMLCVFSLPVGVGALNLRHERYQLRRRVLDIAHSRGLDVHLRVLQYGVTRRRLREVMREGPGWDVVHFSGHGLASRLILEKDDGSRDDVDTEELVQLLRPTRQRLRWVTLSACLSAAATAEETLRWMGLDPARLRDAPEQGDEAEDRTVKRLPVLARTLAEELNCGVLAMRFPVGDEFAIELAQHVYGGVFDGGQALHQALRYAMTELCGAESPAAGRHAALSVATPTLFGQSALDLSLRPRRSRAQPDVRETPLAGFPEPHKRLVGRVRELTQASGALALESPFKGVLFQGMAGGGKTACALETAWQQEDVGRFQWFVWFKAPNAGTEIGRALADFAHALERQLGGTVAMLEKVDRRQDLLDYLPRLADVLRQHSVLIVIDNLESLLRQTAGGTRWQEDRWGDVIDALLAHDGPSRLILTSRLAVPVGGSQFARSLGDKQTALAGRLLSLPVHALSLDETALLARQLPGLRRLLEGQHAVDGFQREAHRQLVCRMLRLVQGHPKLMELADGRASDPAALEAHLARAQQAWAAGDAPLETFFLAGRSELDEQDYLPILAEWTSLVSQSLPEDARRLFEFLCCLEEPDRTQEIIQANWDDYLRRRADGQSESLPGQNNAGGQEWSPGIDSPPSQGSDGAEAPDASAILQMLSSIASDDPDFPDPAEVLKRFESLDDDNKSQFLQMLQQLEQLQHQAQSRKARQTQTWTALQPTLESLLAAGLVERRTSAQGPETSFGIHPGVAEAGRRAAGEAVQAAVDAELAAYWKAAFQYGYKTMMQGGGQLARTAGLRAAPYLIRRQDWQTASTLLEEVIHQDKSPAKVSTVLPLLRRIAAATEGTERGVIDRGVLAKALLAAGRPQEAEAEQLAVADAAEQQQAWRTVRAALAEVVDMMRVTGRAEPALAVVDRMKRATIQAGLGPWSQLADEGRRLQLLNALGRCQEVLDQGQRLRQHMDGLPDKSDWEEAVAPWNVRETLLDTGRDAAQQNGEWQQCLDLSAAILESAKARQASELELAAKRFNDYGPLIRLNRIAEARRLLQDCRHVFGNHNHHEMLGKVFGALADLEATGGHPDRAVQVEHAALRYTYIVGAPGDCAISHSNLANCLRQCLAKGEPVPGCAGIEETAAIAHRLAALCVANQTQDGNLSRWIKALSRELAQLDPSSPAAALAAEDGSGFEAMAAMVEQVEGVRFRELFSRLPTTRAATGPQALQQVLALARSQTAEPSMQDVLQALVAPFAAAAAAGQDIEPLLTEVRQQLAEVNPDTDAAQLDALIAALREAAKGERPA